MAKADFDDIYVAPDPRPYYRTLGELDYQVPAHGSAVFSDLAGAIREGRGLETVRVVDLCCSYGVNAALMKLDISFEDLVEHYAGEACRALDRDAMVERDLRWFGAQQDREGIEVIGIDSSVEAIEYATDVGLLDRGVALDLEVEEPSSELTDGLRDIDLVTVTGGIGYITETTVDKVLDSSESDPWVAAMCLRWIDFEPIAEVGATHGLVTERFEGATFPQRRFADAGERDFVFAALERGGVDPRGKESGGYHHAELYVMRPEPEVEALPLADLVAPALRGIGVGV